MTEYQVNDALDFVESWSAAAPFVQNCRLQERLAHERELTEVVSSQEQQAAVSFFQEYDVKFVSQSVSMRDYVLSLVSDHQLERAFYVMDLGVLMSQLEQWQTLLPRVKPFYAVKCNPHPAILKFLSLLGVGFDCASREEMLSVLNMKTGVQPASIIFANPCKQLSHIRAAKELGVHKMTFDNADELRKIAKTFPEAQLVLRILADESYSVMRFGSKFGAPQAAVRPLLALAQELGLSVIGVSFHVGSSCQNAVAYAVAVRLARNVFDVAKEYGFDFTLLDIGGGFPGAPPPTLTPGAPRQLSFKEIAEAVAPVLEELFDERTTVIAEPGRYFAMATQTLAVNVFAARQTAKDVPDAPGQSASSEAPDYLYYINEGVYGAFNCKVFDHYDPEPIPLQPKTPAPPMVRANIFGPTCDSMDLVCKNKLVPKLEVGDWLYFHNMGAYTNASSSAFNGFKCDLTFFILKHASWS